MSQTNPSMPSPRAGTASAEALSATELYKRYGGVHALRGARLVVRAGEIHALVGANGSGKSTLLGILSGQKVPDSGTVLLGGEPLSFGRPRESAGAGIAIVTQETTLVPRLSVAENIMLGPVKPRNRFGIDWRALHAQADEALARLGLELDLRREVERLRPDERQLVEIARAVSRSARLLILDEATSSLTDNEVAKLFVVLRSLRAQGVAIITVSHRMREIFDVAERVTVLRGGRTIVEGDASDFDADALVEAMTGRAAGTAGVHAPSASSRHALSIHRISSSRVLDNISLDVGEREIVGLAGLMGSGRSELLEVLFGVRKRSAGEILLDDVPLDVRSPQRAIASGLGFVGADRKASGLVMSMSLEENISMVSTGGSARWRPAGRKSERVAATELTQAMGVVAPSLSAAAGSLSGGNQQKVVLAKWMRMNPRVLLLDEPTRGVDVASKLEIYELLRAARERGVAMLLSSSEIPELLAVCDRIAVMARGQIRAVLPTTTTSEAEIISHASAIE
jgi:ABC-type sugar transport system ATPase subunit